MAKAIIKDNVLYVEVPFSMEGKATASRKNTIHATTESGTPDALSLQFGGKKIIVQLNAYSHREAKEEAKAK